MSKVYGDDQCILRWSDYVMQNSNVIHHYVMCMTIEDAVKVASECIEKGLKLEHPNNIGPEYWLTNWEEIRATITLEKWGDTDHRSEIIEEIHKQEGILATARTRIVVLKSELEEISKEQNDAN